MIYCVIIFRDVNNKELSMKALFKKYWHILFILYGAFYMPSFIFLEKNVTEYHLIHCALDDKIPFVEVFIIPYLFWFIFMAIFLILFFFKSQGESVRLYSYLITGMTIAVITFFVYPSGLNLRPETLPRDNFFSSLVSRLYTTDTSTNVLPSLHIYNTLVITVGVFESKAFKHPTAVKIFTAVCAFLICLSTVFLKQHSLWDVLAGFVMAAALYPVFYKTKFFKKFK